ncbi:phosphatidylglycerophosphatase A [Bilophila wadsworthia]|uniref:phosphatidylglycerophosphatase A n=1 Tax=Bilophila wadsworthia TaxID=35833 RepID=UPI0024321D57|nr:phosphatidylglycerophosphatase A [Bilophila wadsworthia]
MDKLILAFCRLGFAGLSPIMPGTCGSALAAVLAPFLFIPLPFVARIVVLVLVFWIGGMAATRGEQILGYKDPGEIVIDELLGMIEGMDVETAKASIERYNELARAGEDTDFFKSPQRLFALENGPFYAAECGCALTLGNLGGLESDEDCHVYNTDRELIPGLYAAGATQGGRFAVQYPISLKGLSCGMCMVYGKIAGENAAAGK